MHVCVMYDEAYDFDPTPFLKDHTWDLITVRRPVDRIVRDLAERDEYDVYLNLCDGAADENFPGLDLVQALEKYNLPFTGGGSEFYDPTREHMQAVAEEHGIGFAKGFHVENPEGVDKLVRGLRYPLMVKHPNSYGSIGMIRRSRVDDPENLREQVERVCARFGSARVEEFIEGREFTVMIADNPDDLDDPFVYPPAELVFPDGKDFLYSDVKWKKDVYFKRVDEDDRDLAERLRDMGKRMYLAMNGTGYGRCDIRMRSDGGLYMLEINPNCGILYGAKELGPADVPIEYDPEGHRGFLDRIFRSAILRQEMRAERIGAAA